ncbi:MAG: 2-oxoglutarate oxidoreductase [Ilumatobacter sp.]|nr:2-oxoglutarate oxidoreductase [Ilumatobacter sp.]
MRQLAVTNALLRTHPDHYDLDDYEGGVARWCTGCGDNAILAALQRLCRDRQLPPEKTVFVSGIGCSSRFPHYMNTYGFHGLHGRPLPIAEGIKIRRPDLDVFVTTGDGDCCAIGTSHWIHALRYNPDITVVMHDNGVYGLTKNQVSPTSPRGLRTNTTPSGSPLTALNPLTVTLGVTNVSFVAQCVDWMPEVVHDIVAAAHDHQGLSFIRILQRCPEYMDGHFEPWIRDPERLLLLTHEDGLQPSPSTSSTYRNQRDHDPADLAAARVIAETTDPIPVGILYRNDDVPCYEDLRRADHRFDPEEIRAVVDEELDRFTIWPTGAAGS